MDTRRPYSVALSGFGSVILLCALLMASSDASNFHPGGEFSTPIQRFLFDLLILGGSLLIFSGGAFALALTPFLRGHRALPAPLLVGIVAGVIAAALAGFGVAGHYGRLFALPGPAAAALPGLLAALCVVPIAFLFARRTSPAPGNGA